MGLSVIDGFVTKVKHFKISRTKKFNNYKCIQRYSLCNQSMTNTFYLDHAIEYANHYFSNFLKINNTEQSMPHKGNSTANRTAVFFFKR